MTQAQAHSVFEDEVSTWVFEAAKPQAWAAQCRTIRAIAATAAAAAAAVSNTTAAAADKFGHVRGGGVWLRSRVKQDSR